MFRLSVHYDIHRGEDGKLVFRDDEIREIAGVSIVDSGCGCGIRDCGLRFETEEALETAKVDLREAGFRFARMCPVHSSE